MASNIKALTGILKNGLFNLTVKSLTEDELEIIFQHKDNDTADVLKDRAIFAIQRGIISSESNLGKDADIIKYLTENDLYEVYTDAAEQLIDKKKQANGKELVTGYFANPAPRAKLAENPVIKMQLDYINFKSEFQTIASELQREISAFKKGQDPTKIKAMMMKLDTLDKTLGQNFSNINATLNLADKIDNLRTLIYTLLMRTRLRLIEKSRGDKKAKQAEFAAFINAYKDALQKKQAFFQTRLQKISEIIPNLQTKVIGNVNKYKNVDLSKCIQLFLRFNNEIIKLDEALQEALRAYAKARGSAKEALAGNITAQQRSLVERIAKVVQYATLLGTKAPVPVQKEIKELLIFYEEYYYLQNTLIQYNGFILEEPDDLNTLILQLSRREELARAPFLYRGDKISYRMVRSYLENCLSEGKQAALSLDARAGVTASIYVLPEEITFYGIVEAEARIFGKNAIKLTFSGNTGFRADSIVGTEEIGSKTKIKAKVSYIFNDFDDATKFILAGFKKYDLFNRLQQVKPLVHLE
jgi:hypothetical protein